MTEAVEARPTGRLAPSPTGLLHLGHARTFLLAWWHVRRRGGRVVLRIEDLDASRMRAGATEAVLRDLSWLGLDWDGPVYIQSRGLERILEQAYELSRSGRAYACVCTRSDVRAASAPQQGDAEPRYAGTCRARFSSLAAAREASGRSAALRFVVAPGRTLVHDDFAGPRLYDVDREVGDFVIVRRDGAPAYQLAVVVDDAEQGINEVFRGDDLLASAARQLQLQRALGIAHPRWFHVPLVVDESGRRLAKRHDDVTLAGLRAAGVDPRAVVAWVANGSGQDVPERVLARDVIPVFDLGRVPKRPMVLTAADVEALRGARG